MANLIYRRFPIFRNVRTYILRKSRSRETNVAHSLRETDRPAISPRIYLFNVERGGRKFNYEY